MIKKDNLIFITLFSLILVLSVYYLTMKETDLSQFSNIKDVETKAVMQEEPNALLSLRVSNEEEVLNTMEELKEVLNNKDSTINEKNDAYEALKELNLNKGKELELEKLVKEELNLECFIKKNGTTVNVVVDSKTHSAEVANKIMKLIQSKYKENLYITVKFN